MKPSELFDVSSGTSANVPNSATSGGDLPISLVLLNQRFKGNRPELAKALGLSKTHLSRVMNGWGRSRELDERANALAVELELLGPGNVLDESSPASPGWRRVPVISWARAGGWTDYEDLCRQIQEHIDAETKDVNAYAVILEGDSMEPRFRAGDRVVASPNSEPRNGDLVVARVPELGALFKEFHVTGKNGSDVKLTSFNPAYDPIVMPRKRFTLIHPVVQVVMNLRR